MEKVKTYLPIIGGLIVAVLLFVVTRKKTSDKSEILEKAREAKLAKSILRKSENEESSSDIGE